MLSVKHTATRGSHQTCTPPCMPASHRCWTSSLPIYRWTDYWTSPELLTQSQPVTPRHPWISKQCKHRLHHMPTSWTSDLYTCYFLLLDFLDFGIQQRMSLAPHPLLVQAYSGLAGTVLGLSNLASDGIAGLESPLHCACLQPAHGHGTVSFDQAHTCGSVQGADRSHQLDSSKGMLNCTLDTLSGVVSSTPCTLHTQP